MGFDFEGLHLLLLLWDLDQKVFQVLAISLEIAEDDNDPRFWKEQWIWAKVDSVSHFSLI